MKRTDYELRNLVSEGRRLQDKFQKKGRINEVSLSGIEVLLYEKAKNSPAVKSLYKELNSLSKPFTVEISYSVKVAPNEVGFYVHNEVAFDPVGLGSSFDETDAINDTKECRDRSRSIEKTYNKIYSEIVKLRKEVYKENGLTPEKTNRLQNIIEKLDNELLKY